ncbi:MAG: hypothetical protein MZU84_08890 [Sphingobacterium sp.]|nr:hypothetical protein [Sphingobacterium sp.]
MGLASCGPGQTGRPVPGGRSLLRALGSGPSAAGTSSTPAWTSPAAPSRDGRPSRLKNTGRRSPRRRRLRLGRRRPVDARSLAGGRGVFSPAAAPAEPRAAGRSWSGCPNLSPRAPRSISRVAFGRRADGAQEQTSFLMSDLWYPRLWWDGLSEARRLLRQARRPRGFCRRRQRTPRPENRAL